MLKKLSTWIWCNTVEQTNVLLFFNITSLKFCAVVPLCWEKVWILSFWPQWQLIKLPFNRCSVTFGVLTSFDRNFVTDHCSDFNRSTIADDTQQTTGHVTWQQLQNKLGQITFSAPLVVVMHHLLRIVFPIQTGASFYWQNVKGMGQYQRCNFSRILTVSKMFQLLKVFSSY